MLSDEHLLNNAATASQHRPLLENGHLREAIIDNIITPLKNEIVRLQTDGWRNLRSKEQP